MENNNWGVNNSEKVKVDDLTQSHHRVYARTTSWWNTLTSVFKGIGIMIIALIIYVGLSYSLAQNLT